MQVYKAVRHGVSEVAVKMVKCVVRLSNRDFTVESQSCPGSAAVSKV